MYTSVLSRLVLAAATSIAASLAHTAILRLAAIHVLRMILSFNTNHHRQLSTTFGAYSMPKPVLLASVVILPLLLPAVVPATVILPDVPAGTPYEILFVTLDTTTATSADINTYNSFVTAEANLSPVLAALTTQHDLTWHVVGSTSTVDAIVNAPDNGVAVYNTQGQLLADAATGIYNGTITNPAQYNQFGNAETSYVFTGSTMLGGLETGNALGDTNVVYGDSNQSNSAWISVNTTSETQLPLYALSSPVPEPSTLVIAMIGASTALFLKRRRRRAASASR